MTPADLFARMSDAIIPEKAKGVNAAIQIDLSGENGGVWVVKINDGTCDVLKEPVEDPDLTIAMDADDYVNLTRGKLNPMTAFMQGKIKIQGDMGLAMKFQSMFRTAPS